MSNYKMIDQCRLCDCTFLIKRLTLTPTPPANEFLDRPKEQEVFPLELLECGDCGHIQLSCVVDPSRLFSNYVYVSGTSPSFVKHFENYATNVIEKFVLQPNDFIVEIGSNDGTLLNFFQNAQMKVLGIDPAKQISERANQNGIETWNEFFDDSTVSRIKEKAKIVVANNVMAHIEDLKGVVKNIKNILADDGVFIFEVSYLVDMCEKITFDLCYHEHLSYHHIGALKHFFTKMGMKLFDVKKIDTHGGSIRCFVSHQQSEYKVSDKIYEMMTYESSIGLKTEVELDFPASSIFHHMKSKIDHIQNELVSRLVELKSRGKTICIYGMPAKITTLMFKFQLGNDLIDFGIDDSFMKIGKYSPGKHIKVLSSKVLYSRKPDYCLIGAWNFADQIIEKHQEYLNQGGHFIVPLPEIREI